MEMVEWEDSFDLGIELIDRHHRHLVVLLNRAYNAVMFEHDTAEVTSIFHELDEYTDYHFKAEEEMMAELGYGRIKSHVLEHETFKAKLSSLDVTVDANVIYFLEEWLLNHIAVVDKAFAAFVKALVDASSRGNAVTTAMVNGKPVTIGLNAYIKP